MRIDRANRAIIAQFQVFLLRQGVQLLFGDGPIVSDLLRVARRIALCVARLEGNGLLLEKVCVADQLHELTCCLTLALEFLAEFDGIIGEFARLAVFEERNFRLVGDHRGFAVNAEHQAVGFFV